MSFPGLLTAVVLIFVCSSSVSASELSSELSSESSSELTLKLTPKLRETCLKTQFYVRPAWDDEITSLVLKIRERINSARYQGKIIVYISMPLTASDSGIREFNKYLGELQKKRLMHQHPDTPMEIILPGQIETMLPPINDSAPQGGEYLYMWTQVLAGENCTGDIDWIYFMDFTDVHFILNLNELPEALKSLKLNKILGYRARHQPELYNETYTTPALRQQFFAYYLKHYSVMKSKGARDEWNIVQMLGVRQHNRPLIRQGYKSYWSEMVKPTVSPGYQQNLPQRPLLQSATLRAIEL